MIVTLQINFNGYLRAIQFIALSLRVYRIHDDEGKVDDNTAILFK